MQPKELKKGIYWVGAIDWNLRNFHGYLTQRGSTYNAYLVVDEKITLIDTVKEAFVPEMMARISKIVDPAQIDYVVCNHVEMDHSGGLNAVMRSAKNATIITNNAAIKGLKAHYKEAQNWNFQAVKSGESVSFGARSLTFVLTPMIHWPDNMVGYMSEEKIFFPNDAFGQHIASSERFDDEYSKEIIMNEAKKYYANIVLPYGKQVQKAMKAVSELDIEMIAPSHGLIYRKHIGAIMEKYARWMRNETKEKALVIYDSMWGSTDKMAVAVAETFEELGISVDMLNVSKNHISDIMTRVIEARFICIGSPTLNNGMMPSVAGFLEYFRGLAPKGRVGLAFGSYGWSANSIKAIDEVMSGCGFDMMDKIELNYVPKDGDLEQMSEDLKVAIKDKMGV